MAERRAEPIRNVPVSRIPEPQRPRDRREHEIGVGDRRQRDEGDAIGEVMLQWRGRCQGEPGLADPTGAGQREQADLQAKEQGLQLRGLLFPADERIERLPQRRVHLWLGADNDQLRRGRFGANWPGGIIREPWPILRSSETGTLGLIPVQRIERNTEKPAMLDGCQFSARNGSADCAFVDAQARGGLKRGQPCPGVVMQGFPCLAGRGVLHDERSIVVSGSGDKGGLARRRTNRGNRER